MGALLMDDLPKYIFRKGGMLWMNIRFGPDDWRPMATGYSVVEDPDGSKASAARLATQERRDAGEDFLRKTGGKKLTVKEYAEEIIRRRRDEQDVASWDDDASRLKTHIYPTLGDTLLHAVRARHIAEVFRAMRATRKEVRIRLPNGEFHPSETRMVPPAPRTIHNTYSIAKEVFRSAQVDGLVDQNPCILKEAELGPLGYADPHFKRGAIYTLDELRQFMTDPRVPQDRQVLYALLGIGCLRHGEAAGLRWWHVMPDLRPLGRIVVMTSYDDQTTKTGVERWMPVHSSLAAHLAEWKLSGWPLEFGRKPEPTDLVVPHTKPTNRGPRVIFGGMRSDHDSYKRMRKDELALGIRRRRTHDLRHTGITAYREDGEGTPGFSKEILHLCTHGEEGDIIGRYTSFGWATLCAQIEPLKFRRHIG